MNRLLLVVFCLILPSAIAIDRHYEGANVTLKITVPTADCFMAGTASTINITLGHLSANATGEPIYLVHSEELSNLKGQFERKNVFSKEVKLSPKLSSEIENSCAAKSGGDQTFYDNCFKIDFVQFSLVKRFWNIASDWKPGNISVEVNVTTANGQTKKVNSELLVHESCKLDWVRSAGESVLVASGKEFKQGYLPKGRILQF